MALWILYFFIFAAEGIIFLLYASALFENKHPKCLCILLVIALYGVLFLLSFFNSMVINGIAFMTCNFLYLILTYNTKWQSALFHAAIATSVSFIAELIIVSIVPYQITFPFSDMSSSQVWLAAVLTKLIYFLIMLLLIHLWSETGKTTIRFDKSWFMLITTPAVSIFIMYTLAILCCEVSIPKTLDLMISICSILLLVLNLIIWEIYNYVRIKSIEMTDLRLSLQKESDILDYYKMIIKQDENKTQLIHDIKNHFQSIAILNKNGEHKKVTEYIDCIINSAAFKKTAQICNHELLNTILCRYLNLCEQSGVSFHADIRNDSISFFKEDDITSLFCNLLDNALEASMQISDAVIELSASRKENTAFSIITIKNSCRKNPFSEKSNRLVSTKKDPLLHGYGIRIIERIVKKYGGEIEYYYSQEDHTFHTIITLKNPG
ncbi:MAG: ATP-binding protein [Clostridiales bacterium]|nr:ATP-binding protein [Clostridiales bacterium]